MQNRTPYKVGKKVVNEKIAKQISNTNKYMLTNDNCFETISEMSSSL